MSQKNEIKALVDLFCFKTPFGIACIEFGRGKVTIVDFRGLKSKI